MGKNIFLTFIDTPLGCQNDRHRPDKFRGFVYHKIDNCVPVRDLSFRFAYLDCECH